MNITRCDCGAYDCPVCGDAPELEEDDFDEPDDYCTDEDADRAEDKWRGDRF